jgi:hypothetical protein
MTARGSERPQHGAHALGLFGLVFASQSGLRRVFPSARETVVGVASALLLLPLAGRVLGWLGFVPASHSALRSAARQGYNLALVPGGVAEMYEQPHAAQCATREAGRG